MKTKLLSLLLFLAMSMGYSQVTSVAIVGADVGGWPVDPQVDAHQMQSTDGVNWTLTNLEIIPAATDSGLKFRANNAWTTNWGSAAFPTGIATLNGANIHGVAGIYSVTFNSETGAFHFEGPPIPVVTLVGAAVSAPEGVAFTTADAVNFTASNVTLLTGGAQFNIDNNGEGGNGTFGGPDFPEGNATDAETMIPVVAGTYTTITYNTSDGYYVFTAAPTFSTISIVGEGAGGWPPFTGPDPNPLSTTDGENYKGVITLTTGAIKFRENNDWTNSWGSTAFPSGIGALNGPDNIPATAGTYDVTFVKSTGAYAFTMADFALVGEGAGGWPAGTPGEVDVNRMTTADGGLTYTLASVTLTTGAVKFRANNAWDINFGGTDFPSGTGVSNGPDNIPAVAGTYSVSLNRVTGAYSFATLATADFNASTFKAYPNPTHNNWNFDSAKEAIESIQIVDVLGKVVLSVAPKATSASVDASVLNNGVYFAKIATATGSKTVKVVKN